MKEKEAEEAEALAEMKAKEKACDEAKKKRAIEKRRRSTVTFEVNEPEVSSRN